MLNITDKAFQEILLRSSSRGSAPALRVGLKAGGCNGLSYLIQWDDSVRETDTVFEQQNAKVIVDHKSLPYLNGATLDYVSSLMYKGFKVLNPNEVSSCGCGESVNFKRDK